jgi:hypothetical protein
LRKVSVLLFKITGSFLNAAATILKRVSVKIFKVGVFKEASQNLYFLHNKAAKQF